MREEKVVDEDRLEELVQQLSEDIDRALPIDGRRLLDLSSSLRAWVSVLEGEGADREWAEDLRSYRNDLEVVNAFFIESGRAELDKTEEREVDEALNGIRSLLGEVRRLADSDDHRS